MAADPASDPNIDDVNIDEDAKENDSTQQQQQQEKEKEEEDLNLPTDLTQTTPQQQRKCMKKLGIKVQNVGDFWYPIDKKWYDSWERYTMMSKGDDDIPGGIENLHEIGEPRPGKIDNSALQDQENPEALRKDIQENRTHIWIHSEVWKLLIAWYHGGPAFPRKVYQRGGNYSKEKYICIYPQYSENSTPDQRGVVGLRNLGIYSLTDYFLKNVYIYMKRLAFVQSLVTTQTADLDLQTLHVGDYIDIKFVSTTTSNYYHSMQEFAIGLVTNIQKNDFMSIQLQPGNHKLNVISDFQLQRIDIKNGKIPSNITIKPINTYTEYHRSIFNKKIPCPMYAYCKQRCNQCRKPFCTKCASFCIRHQNWEYTYKCLAWYYTYMCLKCLSSTEKNWYCTILAHTIPTLLREICNYIAAYCVTSIILNCCSCKEEIIVNNILDYELQMDCYYNKFSSYKISLYYQQCIDLYDKYFDYQSGKYIYQRIICNKCASDTHKMKCCGSCSNYDVQFDISRDLTRTRRETDEIKICFAHTLYECSLCNEKKLYSLFRCKDCHEMFCVFDGIFKVLKMCKRCVLLEERRELNNLICDVFEELLTTDVNEVVGIIIDYSVGYLLQCHNYKSNESSGKCHKDIIIKNKFDYYMKKRNKNFYDYSITYLNGNESNLIPNSFIYGKYRRVFCKHCYENEMYECMHMEHSGDYIIKEIDESFMCGKHRFCKICGIRNDVDFAYCRKCRNNFCIMNEHCDNVINGVCKKCIVKTYSNSVKRALRFALKELSIEERIIEVIVEYVIETKDVIKHQYDSYNLSK
eukprot:14768_1